MHQRVIAEINRYSLYFIWNTLYFYQYIDRALGAHGSSWNLCMHKIGVELVVREWIWTARLGCRISVYHLRWHTVLMWHIDIVTVSKRARSNMVWICSRLQMSGHSVNCEGKVPPSLQCQCAVHFDTCICIKETHLVHCRRNASGQTPTHWQSFNQLIATCIHKVYGVRGESSTIRVAVVVIRWAVFD